MAETEREDKSIQAFRAFGSSRKSANEPNPRRRAPFPRNTPHLGTAPKGARMARLARSTPRSRVIPMHPVESGHIT
jgi:hypothetical protein